MKKIHIDLREFNLLYAIAERYSIEAGDGMVTFKNAGLPRGTYKIAEVLAVAAFERFIREIFMETASKVLKIPPNLQEKYASNISRKFQSPNSEVIKEMFGLIGVFGIYDIESSRFVPSDIKHRLDRILLSRNLTSHGKNSEEFEKELGNATWAPINDFDPLSDKVTKIKDLEDFFIRVSASHWDVINDKIS